MNEEIKTDLLSVTFTSYLTKQIIAMAEAHNVDPKGLVLTSLRATLKAHREIKKEAKISPLDDAQKKYVSDNLTLGNGAIAQHLKVRPAAVKKYRLELATDYVEQNYLLESDIAISVRFGLHCNKITKLRKELGLNKDGAHGVTRSKRKSATDKLGSDEEIGRALREEGETLESLGNRIGVCRERIRQELLKRKIPHESSLRTVLWYAFKIAGKDHGDTARNLANKEWVRARLEECGSPGALAGKIGVSEIRLANFIKKRHGLDGNGIAPKKRGELVTLQCALCKEAIVRRKSVVASQPSNKYFCNNDHRNKYNSAYGLREKK